jgi:hypothetical protein
MRVDVHDFRSIYLTVSTLLACQETNAIQKAGPHTYRFGGKYTDGVWVEKKKVVSKNTYNPILFSSLRVIHPSVKHYNFSVFVFFGFSPALRKPVFMDSLEEKFPTKLPQCRRYRAPYLFLIN